MPKRTSAIERPPAPLVLVFDSGLGGLTVFREIVKARPDASYVYVADDAFFPYGQRAEAELVERLLTLTGELIAAHHPDLFVIACNTASTIALPQLRARYALAFVGTVPAIKPACSGSRTMLVSVLGTRATVKREYTQALIRDYAQGCAVTLVGSARLADLAERALRYETIDDDLVRAEIAPCFQETGARRTDTIVLACTHYPLLIERLRRLAPWPVAWVDPAPAIARRVIDLIGPPSPDARMPTSPARAIFTSGHPAPPALATGLAAFGLAPDVQG
ncbi:MAG: glutamate racemase [Proteobacteria bacterium]|nr:glutamate racemase [Pseudomonadota bacterium]